MAVTLNSKRMLKTLQVLAVLLLVMGMVLPGTKPVQASTIPTFSIVSVVEDDTVTIKTYNFPADLDFKVTMGKYGTQGIGGVEVATINSGSGGSFEKTFDIPDSLVGDYRIAIRLDSGVGYYSYNWFYNNTSSGSSSSSGYTGIPTINIVSVVEDDTVTIKTHNFPADIDFKVRMGKYGTQGIDGEKVDTINSGSGGSFEKTFDIPDDLKGDYRIAIRLEGGVYYAYNWFYNNTSDGSSSSGYSGIPTFKILSVEEDDTVTIKTNNFPKDMDFKVLMGEYGTKGVGGIEVTTINSGSGGSFEDTYDIPDDLKGDYRIAIRLESTNGVYYAYNWFYNNSTTGSPSTSGYTGIPTFSIVSVVEDDQVTIKTNNFPEDMDFTVTMGAYGTAGVGGVVVETTNSGSGGSFELTYDIPASLHGDYRIAIRLDSGIGYYAYNWFYNNSTD